MFSDQNSWLRPFSIRLRRYSRARPAVVQIYYASNCRTAHGQQRATYLSAQDIVIQAMKDVIAAGLPAAWFSLARLAPTNLKSRAKSSWKTTRGYVSISFAERRRAIGSGVEHILHTDGVTSSNLVSPTIKTAGQRCKASGLFFFGTKGDTKADTKIESKISKAFICHAPFDDAIARFA